jgi:hypothetical protein
MDLPDAPIPKDGFLVTHFLTVVVGALMKQVGVEPDDSTRRHFDRNPVFVAYTAGELELLLRTDLSIGAERYAPTPTAFHQNSQAVCQPQFDARPGRRNENPVPHNPGQRAESRRQVLCQPAPYRPH